MATRAAWWQAGLAEQGFHAPSEVQAAAIPVILQGRNVGVQSYTGSGKVGGPGTALAPCHVLHPPCLLAGWFVGQRSGQRMAYSNPAI